MSREEILAGLDGDGRRSKLVDLPGWPRWPARVLVKEFGALDAVRWRHQIPRPEGPLPEDPKEALAALQAAVKPGEDIISAAKMIVLCVYEEDGSKPLFKYEDWEKVANMGDKIVEFLTKEVSEINGVSKEEIARAEADFGGARS